MASQKCLCTDRFYSNSLLQACEPSLMIITDHVPIPRHLSVADLIYLLFVILPWSVTSYYRRWVFGDIACTILGAGYTLCGTACVGFLIAIAAHRLGRCVSPLTVSWLTRRRAVWVLVILWLFSLLPILAIFLSRSPIVFNPTVSFCVPSSFLDFHAVNYREDIYIWTCFSLMVGLNIAILVKAHLVSKQIGRLRWVAVKTVCMVCGVFLIGNPLIIQYTIQGNGITGYSPSIYIPLLKVKLFKVLFFKVLFFKVPLFKVPLFKAPLFGQLPLPKNRLFKVLVFKVPLFKVPF